MRKNILTLQIVMILLIMTGGLFAQTATPPSNYSTSDGSESDPYLISSLNNLYWLSQNSGKWDKNYEQTADIDASGTSGWDSGAGFSPIGNNSTDFTGSYNGQDYTINELTINKSSTNLFAALFGQIDGATIENLGITNVDITGEYCLSGLVGGAKNSTIKNCYSTGSVYLNGSIAGNQYYGGLAGYLTNSTMSNCYSTANVSGDRFVGGLIGLTTNYSTISNCFSKGSVSGEENIGGLIGYTAVHSNVSNCYSRGSVSGDYQIGGLVGFHQNSNIDKCYSTGSVSGNSRAGGLVGYTYTVGSYWVTNSFWDTQTSGQSSSSGGTGKTTAAMKNVATFTDESTAGLDDAWDFVNNPNDDNANNDYWDMDQSGTVNDGYPILLWGESSEDAVYITDFNNFPAYPYNTTSYKQGGAFVGCGPTTGAMIFGYFDHVYDSDLLHNPVSGVNEGLGTAWRLHSSSYMNTGANGFGSVLDIEPGLENYADNKGEIVDAMIHVGTDYDPNSANANWLNDYGPYGSSWNNDGDFWVHNQSNDTWSFDVEKFCDFVEPKLLVGIPIFLTIDTDMDKGGDHWVPLVGFHRTNEEYYYYDTYSTTLRTGPIHYCSAPGAAQDNAISFLRTVTYTGESEQCNPPTSLAVLSGYHQAVSLAWKSPNQVSSGSGSKTLPVHPHISVGENNNSGTKDENSIQTWSFIKPIIEAEPQFMKKSKTTLHRSTENSISYNVYRSTSSGGNYSKIANNINRTYYRDEPVTNGQTYYYKVTAVYSSGESNFSNTASGNALSSGYFLNSGWASSAPNLNGNINSSEWSNAATTTITYPGESGTVTLYVMNDANYLYFAVNDVIDNSLDDDDTFGIFFDENHNRELPSSGSSNEGLIQMFWDSGSNSALSTFLGAYGYFPNNLNSDGWTTPSGVSQEISQSSGHVQYEGRIDLNSSPLQSSPGNTIGIAFYSWDGGSSSFTGLWLMMNY